jgi:hypothetical protein
MKHEIMKIPKVKENGEMPLDMSLVIWISKKFERLSRKRIFKRIGELSSVNGYSRKKRKRIFRARLVFCGYICDFDNFEPVL